MCQLLTKIVCLTFLLELFGFILENFLDISDTHIRDFLLVKNLDTLFLENKGPLGFSSHGSKPI